MLQLCKQQHAQLPPLPLPKNTNTLHVFSLICRACGISADSICLSCFLCQGLLCLEKPCTGGCALTELAWTQAGLFVAADLVASLFRPSSETETTESVAVQRRRYVALQLLPVLIDRVPAELDKHVEGEDVRRHCILALAVLVRPH